MIKQVIFDLGRVMYTFWPREYLKQLGYGEEETNSLMGAIFDHPLWADLDRGVHTIADGMALFSEANPALAEEVKRIFHENWIDEVIQIMPESLAFYQRLKREGYRLYILSNFAEDSFARVYARDAFLREADGMIISAHAKLLKPERGIYEKLLQQYGLIPSECVFIDDNADNIRAAEALGIKGIVFTDIAACIAAFERLVGKCRI